MRRSARGFAFVEILVAMLIFSLIVGGFYAVLGVGNTTYFMDTNFLDLQQQARNAMDRIIREVRQSSTVTITVIDANSDKITFTTPTKTGIQYYRSGTQLVREYPSGITKTIANNIAYLKFTLSGTLLKISLRADKSFFRTLQFPLVESVRLRNE